MPRSLTSLAFCLLLLLSALGGGAPQAGPLPVIPEAPRSCPCMPGNPCQCPNDAPCHLSQDLPAPAAPMVVSSLQWPQAPGQAAWGWLAAPPAQPPQVVASSPPPAPPPEPLYLLKASLLI